MSELLDLLDYRRRVFELYREVRATWDSDPRAAHEHWRAVRDQLFARHPQSALLDENRQDFAGLPYYDYDPQYAVVAHIDTDVEQERFDVGTSGEGTLTFVRFGVVTLPWGTLDAYWLDAYGGGVFLPFRDATAGDTTYGAGRYLLDTVKGADLGSTPSGQLVLDFNFAYHPSCRYNPKWSCPLAPPGNRLDERIEAGEQL
jgi:uncharacterized protein (DUF1684 family)